MIQTILIHLALIIIIIILIMIIVIHYLRIHKLESLIMINGVILLKNGMLKLILKLIKKTNIISKTLVFH
jgi:hypothetical protein